jgi:hypothetical protein
MADEKPKKVTVEAIKFHTNAGEAYEIGDSYDVDESAVDSLAANGFAIRVDRAAHAKKAAKPAKPAKKAKKGRR